MKILITGIDGFIGKHIAKTLVHDGHNVVGISNGTFADSNIEFHQVDLTDKDTVIKTVVSINPDFCIHLAAMANTDVHKDKETLVRKVNVDGSIHLFDALEKTNCNQVIYFSTVKVLAGSTDDIGIEETSTPSPNGIYATTKYEVECELAKRAKRNEWQYAIVRPVPVLGTGDTKGNYVKMLKMVKRGFFPLLDGGKGKRSIVFADTIAKRISQMVSDGVISGRAYVFSDGDYTIKEIVDSMRCAAGFSFCPEISIEHFQQVLQLVDHLAASLHLGDDRISSIINRLSSSYVVKTTLFETDYGPQEKIVLINKMQQIADAELTTQQKPDLSFIRALDTIFASAGLIATAPLMAAVLSIGYFDTGSPIFTQERVGKNQKPFTLIKFRTMKKDTASVASHLASESAITPLGKFLRRTKLDELPQLINVLKGEMSFVGPRPNLFNQKELICEREKRGVYEVLPGITGLAQINNIDMSTPALLAETDEKMIRTLTLKNYFTYIMKTASGSGSGDAVNAPSR